jgi:hypothetical protein
MQVPNLGEGRGVIPADEPIHPEAIAMLSNKLVSTLGVLTAAVLPACPHFEGGVHGSRVGPAPDGRPGVGDGTGAGS